MAWRVPVLERAGIDRVLRRTGPLAHLTSPYLCAARRDGRLGAVSPATRSATPSGYFQRGGFRRGRPFAASSRAVPGPATDVHAAGRRGCFRNTAGPSGRCMARPRGGKAGMGRNRRPGRRRCVAVVRRHRGERVLGPREPTIHSSTPLLIARDPRSPVVAACAASRTGEHQRATASWPACSR